MAGSSSVLPTVKYLPENEKLSATEMNAENLARPPADWERRRPA
jgi:hypothetical protein